MNKFGKMLKKARDNIELSLGSVSKKTGVSAAYIMHLEKGIRKNPSVTVFLTLCRFYGFNPASTIFLFEVA